MPEVISAPTPRHFYSEQIQPPFGPKSITTSLTSSLKPKQISCPHTEPVATKPSFCPGRSPRTGPCKTSSRCSRRSLTRTLLRDLFGQATPLQRPLCRARHAITVTNRYPLPLVQDIIDPLLRASEGAYNSIINNEHIYPFGKPWIQRSLYI